MDRNAGQMAAGATKLATTVAYKMSALYQESAQHHTAAAMELDNSRRMIERYVLGTDEDGNREMLAAPMEENPQRYYDFPYKLGSETWSTNYPVPQGPQFATREINDFAQYRNDASALEHGPVGWALPKEKGMLGKVLGMGPLSHVDDSLLVLLRSPQLQRGVDMKRSSSCPSRLKHSVRSKPSTLAHSSAHSLQNRPVATVRNSGRSSGYAFL